MGQVLALVDTSVYTNSVADYAAWAAGRIGAQVELLQVLGRREATSQDRSGRIVAGARRQLLEKLAALDAERAKLLQSQGRMHLEEVAARLAANGVEGVTIQMRHGDLLEALEEHEPGIEMIAMGKRGEAADFAKLHLGSNLERVLRTARVPVLVASRGFKPIKKAMIAFDGRMSAVRAVDALAASPLLKGVPLTLIHAGDKTVQIAARIEAAVAKLQEAGHDVTAVSEPGLAVSVIPERIEADNIDLLVMGAYGHSRLRSLVIGSTTSEMIRSAFVPVLVYR